MKEVLEVGLLIVEIACYTGLIIYLIRRWK